MEIKEEGKCQEPFIEEVEEKEITNKELYENTETNLENVPIDIKDIVNDFQTDILKSVFSWKYLAIALFLGLIPSLVDLITDILNGTTFLGGNYYTIIQGNCSENYEDDDDDDKDDDDIVLGCFQKDTVYGISTLCFVFIPGLNIYPFIFSNLPKMKTPVKHFFFKICVILLCLLTFPLLLILSKLCCLINHGKNMKTLAFQLVFSKGLLDSTLQLCFQGFVMISRAERVPSWIQIISFTFSFLALTKINTENFLINCKDLNYMFGKSLKQKLAISVKFVPLFFFTIVFRCLSYSIIFALLGLYSFLLYSGVTFLFIIVEHFLFNKAVRKDERTSFLNYIFSSSYCEKSVLKALPSHLFTLTTSGNHMFHMTFFLIFNNIILSVLTILTNLGYVLFQSSGGTSQVDNLLLLNSLIVISIVSGILSMALYIHQIVFNKMSSSNAIN